MQALKNHSRLQGLSLIEFMTVVAIIVISTTVATPFMGDLIARYQAEAASHQLLATLKYCRVEALKRKNIVHCDINASEEEKNVVSTVYADDDNSNSYTQAGDTLLSFTTVSNTGFLQISPASTSWSYDRQGLASNNTIAQIKLCSKIAGQLRPLSSIFIDPLGVSYIQEARENDACD